MSRNSLFKKVSLFLLIFILIFDSLAGVSNAAGVSSQQNTIINNVETPRNMEIQGGGLLSPSPSPSPTSHTDSEVPPEFTPTPTLAPTPTSKISALPLIAEGNEIAESKSSVETLENQPAEGYDVMSEPDVKTLFQKYSTLYNDKQVNLDLEQIRQLFALGASISDVYAIALLHDMYNEDSPTLWELKQKSKDSWLEIEDKLRLENSQSAPAKVTDGVYKDEERTSLLLIPRVTDVVYEERPLVSSDQPKVKYSALVSLSGTIDDAMSELGLKDKYQTFNQQFSDQQNTTESIDPITGMLTWRSNQISLPGRDGLDLNLGVTYQSNGASQFYPATMYDPSEGRSINTGAWDDDQRYNYLGLGWTFNIPSLKGDYYNDGKGGQYESKFIKPTDGSDAYYTLKDYPTGDVRITHGSSGTTLVFPDKSREYFSSDMMIQTDRFGNTITYYYNSYGNVNRIEDTLGRVISFEYKAYGSGTPSNEPNVRVRVLENGVPVKEIKYFQQSIGFNNATGLIRIEATNDEKIQFEYAENKNEYDFFGNILPSNRSNGHYEYMLKRVQYNNTSQTVYDYEYGVHNLSKYGVIKKSRVSGRSDIILRNSLPSYVMNHNVFTYSGDYSAYGVTNDPENLPAGYHFSSTVTALDKNNAPLQKTITLFNHLKQNESVESKIISGSQAGQRILTLYSNFLTDYKYKPTLIEQREYEGDADTNPNTLYTDLTYDSLGYVQTETLPLSNEKRNNAALKQKYTLSYQYDPKFKLLSSKRWYQNETDGTPVSETVVYTSDGRIEKSTNAAGEVTIYSYLKDNSAFTVTAENWKGGLRVAKSVIVYGSAYNFAYPTEKQQWFNLGQPNQQIVKTQMSYDKGNGLLISEIKGNQQKTTYTYDELGRLLKITKPNFTNSNGDKYSETEEYRYSYNQISTNFDSVNAGTYSFVVDTEHTLTQTSNGNTVKSHGITFYNGLGQTLLEERKDPNAGKYTQTQYHYDEWNRPVYIIDPARNTMTVSYDAWGRQNRATNANGDLIVSDYALKARRSTSYLQDKLTGERLNYAEQSFDAWGNKISASTYKDWPANQQRITEAYRYDIVGRVTGYTDPNKNLNEDGVTTSYTYDALGRLIAVKDALNQTTTYTYDGNGQLSKVTIQAKGGTPQTLNTKTYNELGLVSVKQDGASQMESSTYNNLGQLETKRDRNGSTFGYVYDERGQLKKSTIRGILNNVAQTQETNVIFGDGSPEKQTIQTRTNNAVTATQTQTLDSLGQMRTAYSVSGNHSTMIGNQVDVIGRFTQINDTYMGFYTNYQYYQQRLNKVQTNGSSTLSSDPSVNAQYSYYANDLVDSIVYPTLSDGTKIVTKYTYNKALGWMETLKNTKGSSVLSGYSYSYDNNGNRITVRESRKDGAAQTTSYGYDPLNRLVSITRQDGSRIAYTYDVRGNRQTVSDTGNGSPDTTDTSYTYDLQNTLTGVTKGGKATSFQYYADGMRYLKTNGNTQTQVNYNFQGQVISEEKIVSGVFVEQANFVRGDRVLVKKDKKASKDYYYLYNGHGDVVQIVNTSGEVVNNYTYDEWGNITSQVEGTSNSFKYTGEVYDAETGLYYLRARYYDPSIGRFLNEDTVEGQIDNPLSMNLYTYVENNPLTRIDPTGHYTESQVDLMLTTARIAGSGSQLYWDIRKDLGDHKPMIFLGNKQREKWLNLFNIATSFESSDAQASWAKSQLMKEYGEEQSINDAVVGAILGMTGGGGKPLSPLVAAERIVKAERVGTALAKSDVGHRSASFLTEKILAMGKTFIVKGNDGVERTLLQVKGELNGSSGIYEYIINLEGKVTHQRFIVKGKITGYPNQKP